jgi:ABC-type multidrug transport system fused ATPase/permease subunit
MNIFYYLCNKFFSKEKTNIIILAILSLTLSFFYTNISSIVNANIIQGIQKNDFTKVFTNFKYFIGVSIIFIITYYFYKLVQNNVLTRLAHWTKSEIFNFILLANNENMRNVNFVEFITPITRISNSCNMLLSDIISSVVPTISFLTVIFAYFIYKDRTLGIGFLLGNLVIVLYFLYHWKDMFEYKQNQEKKTVNNEKYIIDAFNNIDKIIYRGEVNNEIDIFHEKTEDCIDYSIDMLKYMTDHSFAMNAFVYVIIILALFHMIRLYFKKKMEAATFITFLSILMMYRDDISGTIQRIPTYIESFGRVDLIVKEFEMMIGEDNANDKSYLKTVLDKENKYSHVELKFETIRFENVTFKYDNRDQTIFKNYNKELYLKDKIIGITGLSGNGKSSFVKLLMRLHECNEGAVYIDEKNIKTIDPFYIRQNITYVNQNSRLFNRKIMENILYGCKDTTRCNENLREILSYSKIQELYRNVDISTSEAGPLGENLSGGQRQVINVISGLVNPTKILILDEPTNALDPELKRELLLILKNFRKYKTCIMIITHDRDVYSLFDDTLEI